MQLPINKDGNIELDLWQIINEVVHRATPEELDTILDYFRWQKPIRELVCDMLANEFSRPSYYEGVHEDRIKLLKAIKEEELNYYASLIVDKMADEHRHNKAYWEIYHWCSDHNITRMEGFPHQALKSDDWKWKQELEETVETIIRQERPDLLEVKEVAKNSRMAGIRELAEFIMENEQDEGFDDLYYFVIYHKDFHEFLNKRGVILNPSLKKE